MYVGEDGGGRVRKIDASGLVTTFAGTGDSGFRGDGGSATGARVNPFGVAASTDGTVYLAEPWNGRVRRIDRSGTITTFAGGGEVGSGEGIAAEALLDAPRGIAVQTSGDEVFGEWGRLWKLNAAGEVARLYLTANEGDADLEGVEDIAVDTSGNLYVAERSGHRISRIDTAGTITRFAGTGERGTSGDGGPASEAALDTPVAVAVDSLGNVYVVDRDAHRVRKVDPTGTIGTFAGTGERGISGDGGPATAARLESPRGVAVDSLGNVYIADREGHRIRRVDGSGTISFFADQEIQITHGSIATDTDGNVYAGGDRRIRRIEADGAVSTIAGTGEDGYGGDGGPARSARFSVSGLAVDQAGNVWFADRISRRIRVLRKQGH